PARSSLRDRTSSPARPPTTATGWTTTAPVRSACCASRCAPPRRSPRPPSRRPPHPDPVDRDADPAATRGATSAPPAPETVAIRGGTVVTMGPDGVVEGDVL